MDMIGDMIVDAFANDKIDSWLRKHLYFTTSLAIFIYPGSQIVLYLIFI